MADEISFYTDQNGVRVTDKRVILANTTYSLANITSVATSVEKPKLFGPIATISVGVLLVLSGAASKSAAVAIIGFCIAAFGYFWYRGSKPIWHLRIASASGEATPLKSLNQQWISSIAQAINEAIIHRA